MTGLQRRNEVLRCVNRAHVRRAKIQISLNVFGQIVSGICTFNYRNDVASYFMRLFIAMVIMLLLN